MWIDMKKPILRSSVISFVLISTLLSGLYKVSAEAMSIDGRDSKEVDSIVLNSSEDVTVDISEDNFFNYYDVAESNYRFEDNLFYPELSLSYVLKPEIANRIDDSNSAVEITIEGRYEFALVTSLDWNTGEMSIADWSDDEYINLIYEINTIMNTDTAEQMYSPKLHETVKGNREIVIPLNRFADGIWEVGFGGVRGPISPIELSYYVKDTSKVARLCDLQITSVSGSLKIKHASSQSDHSDQTSKNQTEGISSLQTEAQSLEAEKQNVVSETVINGQILKQPDYECIAPLEISADYGSNYYVYLKYIGEPLRTSVSRNLNSGVTVPYESDMAFYVESGKKVEVEVPIGIYRLYYATGDTFYGSDLLFGEDTRYTVSEENITFYGDTQYIHGCSITLYKVVNGNFSTEQISEEEFPK